MFCGLIRIKLAEQDHQNTTELCVSFLLLTELAGAAFEQVHASSSLTIEFPTSVISRVLREIRAVTRGGMGVGECYGS